MDKHMKSVTKRLKKYITKHQTKATELKNTVSALETH